MDSNKLKEYQEELRNLLSQINSAGFNIYCEGKKVYYDDIEIDEF